MMKLRIGVVAIIRNSRDEVLICKMPKDRGAYPGQWAIPGGGVDEGEKMEEALRREMREEVGMEIGEIDAFWFQDDVVTKLIPGEESRELYMIHLIFDCVAKGDAVTIDNRELVEFAWVKPGDLREYDLNRATVKTFQRKGWL
jgi:nucleoside triphosphatase